MAKTGIEWTEATWNPIVGCSIVSPGCTNCYAMTMAARLKAMGTLPHYAGTTRKSKGGPVWTGKLALAPEASLLAPLRRRKPTTYFVNSMGDLFHEDVPDEWIDWVFAVMALAPQHKFQVLTKRSARMRSYVEEVIGSGRWLLWTHPALGHPIFDYAAQWRVMFRHVWLGVSAEDQNRADERVPDLLATPAAIRFVSAEPLLGPIDFVSKLGGTLWMGGQRGCDGTHRHGGRAGEVIHGILHEFDPRRPHHHHDDRCRQGLDWIIVGGESGPRPMLAEWAQQIRDQCTAAGTAFFFKQWGSHIPAGQTMANGKVWAPGCGTRLRATKAITGRLLDGVEHNAMPRAA